MNHNSGEPVHNHVWPVRPGDSETVVLGGSLFIPQDKYESMTLAEITEFTKQWAEKAFGTIMQEADRRGWFHK